MHILIISEHLNPSSERKPSLALDHLAYWVNSGARITIIAPRTSDDNRSEKIKKFILNESHHDFDIITVKDVFGRSTSKIIKLLNRTLYNILSFFLGINLKGWDIVVSATPSLSTGTVGLILGKVKNNPIIIEQHHQKYYKHTRLEKLLMTLSDHIVISGNDFNEADDMRLSRTGITKIPAGYRMNFCSIHPPESEIFFMEKGTFKVGYLGHLDDKHYLDNILQAAISFEKSEEIHFYLVGDGPYKKFLEERILHENITNVSLYGAQSQQGMISILAQMDTVLYLGKNEEREPSEIPESFLIGMALEKPLIINQNGQLQKIMIQMKAGLIVNADSVFDLHNTIEKLYQDSALREKLGKNGRKYILKIYSPKAIDLSFQFLLNAV